MRLKVAYCIEHGIHKTECEDSALICDIVINDACGEIELHTPGIICLCDGVGGNAGGKEASLYITDFLSHQPIPESVENLRNLFYEANKSLLQRADMTVDHKLMATTCTGIVFSEMGAFLAHVGNTRLYSSRGSFLQQITKDQTTYQWLLDKGDEETASFCNRSEIRGALGGGREDLAKQIMVEQVFNRRVPNLMLLTTDGVHDTLSQDEIEDTISGSNTSLEKAKLLCKKAAEQGSEDDRSAIVISSEPD